MKWPWKKSDELAPETSVEEAQQNAKNLEPDHVDSDKVPRATKATP